MEAIKWGIMAMVAAFGGVLAVKNDFPTDPQEFILLGVIGVLAAGLQIVTGGGEYRG